MSVTVERVDNGYILNSSYPLNKRQQIFTELADVFAEMLAMFEGRRESFGGDMYGAVAIFRVKQAAPSETPAQERARFRLLREDRDAWRTRAEVAEEGLARRIFGRETPLGKQSVRSEHD